MIKGERGLKREMAKNLAQDLPVDYLLVIKALNFLQSKMYDKYLTRYLKILRNDPGY